MQLRFRPGRIDHAQRPRDDAGIGDVPVAFGADEGLFTVAIVGSEEAVEFGEVHPLEQVRVVGRVGPAVGRLPRDSFVYAMDGVDGLLSL